MEGRRCMLAILDQGMDEGDGRGRAAFGVRIVRWSSSAGGIVTR
jgi:hypothetical protein